MAKDVKDPTTPTEIDAPMLSEVRRTLIGVLAGVDLAINLKAGNTTLQLERGEAERVTASAKRDQTQAERERDAARAQLAEVREAVKTAQEQLAATQDARKAEDRGRVADREQHALLTTELAKLRKIAGVPEKVPA